MAQSKATQGPVCMLSYTGLRVLSSCPPVGNSGSEMMVVVPSLLVPRHWWELGAEGPGLCFPCGRERQREGISTYLISMGTSLAWEPPTVLCYLIAMAYSVGCCGCVFQSR